MSHDVQKEVDSPEMRGWLYKWTNYIKGYQKRWFVLSNGLLSYYRNQAEMVHACRGTICLHGAVIHTEDFCNILVSNGGGTQTFHLRSSSEVERLKWVTALELAKAKAIQQMESEDEAFEEKIPNEMDKHEFQNSIKTMSTKLEDLQTCNDLIVKHGQALQRALANIENTSPELLPDVVKCVNERATLFKITSKAMIKVSSEYLHFSLVNGKKWQKMLSHEHEQRLRLEDMVEQLARQISHLENMARKEQKSHGVKLPTMEPDASSGASPRNCGSPSGTTSDDDDLFEDAIGEHEQDFTVACPLSHKRNISNVSQQSEGEINKDDDAEFSSSEQDDGETITVVQRKSENRSSNDLALQSFPSTPVHSGILRTRRERVPNRPDKSVSLWGIMKNCIGKDLSKIPLPVNFSEPLSMLQRLVEDFEYSEILDKAALCQDNIEQLAYVAAFTVSSYSTTAMRTGKPFNPLLGETYECDRRDDKGWKCISEQVSHHPPMVAQYCESNEWRAWQEFTMASKFRGKYLQIIPLGIAHLEFKNTGNHYTWRKVASTVNNIIIGKLWIDQSGDMEITNHKTGDKCHLKFAPYSYFTRDIQRKVTGTIIDTEGKVRWVLNGTWDTKMDGAKVIGETVVKGKASLESSTTKQLWKVHSVMPESAKYYNFTKFACELNEPEEGVAFTDSRLRPDQRMMENGQWDEANEEKIRLEEKQRAARRQREMDAELATSEGKTYEGYQPVWFKKVKDEISGNIIHIYDGKYWDAKQKQDWSACPNIF